MQNSKLWRAFATLSPTELKQFGWFLDSPYHNRRDDTRALFRVLKAARHADPFPENHEIWQESCPDQPWSDAGFRHLCRYLLALLEEFLALNAYRKTEDRVIRTAEIYAARGLDDMAAALIRQAKGKRQAAPGRDSASLLNAFLGEQLAYRAHQRDNRSFRPGLQAISDALDRWYLVQKLKLACTMGSQQKVFRAEYNLALLEPVLDLAARDPWRDEPLVAIYARTYAMLSEEHAEGAYRAQVDLLARHAALLSPDEQRTLSLMAINYCIRKLNQGQAEYLAEVYQLYKRGLADGWLFEQGQLSPWTYKNVVSAGLKLGDFAWVGEFIEECRDDLPPDFQATFYLYNRAELQFALGDFRAVLRSLSFLQIRDSLTQLRARILQIKAGYELEEYRLVESQLENLRQLLRRKKELAYHREAYRNFERFLRRLMGLGPDADRGDFRRALAGMEIVAEREWLEAKGR